MQATQPSLQPEYPKDALEQSIVPIGECPVMPYLSPAIHHYPNESLPPKSIPPMSEYGNHRKHRNLLNSPGKQ